MSPDKPTERCENCGHTMTDRWWECDILQSRAYYWHEMAVRTMHSTCLLAPSEWTPRTGDEQ